jgi:AraC family L-rhamnose operon regulatory protein RhaS
MSRTIERISRPIEVRFPDYGVFVLESHHDVGFRMESTRHHFTKVLYILEGTGTIEGEEGPIPCRSHDVIVVPVGRTHCLVDARGKPISLYALCVEDPVFTGDPELKAALPVGRLNRKRLLSTQVRSMLRRILFEQTLKRPAVGSMIRGLTLELLALLARVGHHEDPEAAAETTGRLELRHRVEAYAADLERRFFETASLDQVAQRLGMSRRRFTQLFRQVTGMAWLDRIQQLRVEHAKHLLAETNRSVTAVAFECGYEDLSSFYRAFRRTTGSSPQKWREKRK